MEWRIFKSDEFLGMTNIQEWRNLENDKLSGMTNFWECQIFENEEFSGMMDFLEWWIFGNQESLEWQIQVVHWNLFDLTLYKGLWVVVYLLNGHLSKDLAPKMGYQYQAYFCF